MTARGCVGPDQPPRRAVRVAGCYDPGVTEHRSRPDLALAQRSGDIATTPTESRTALVERMVADFAGRPLMRETVFHSAKYLDGRTQKEVCDVLLVHRGQGILLSVKAQGRSRDPQATTRWLAKNGAKAVAQLGGAYRTLASCDSWCEHPLSGRKLFGARQIAPVHGLALLESSYELEVELAATCLDRHAATAPVTLMSIRDFLHVMEHLRTWRDLKAYLDARAAVVREPDRRVIGAESALFAYYTATRDTFSGCRGIADAKIVRAAGQHVRPGSAFRDRERILAAILEDFLVRLPETEVSDIPEVFEELRPFMTADRDVLTDALCSLSIQERAAIGEQIGHLCARAGQSTESDPLYGTVRFDRHPDTVYVVVVGGGKLREASVVDALDLTIAACAFHERATGIYLVINQAGSGIRFHIGRADNVEPTVEMVAAGQEYFGRTRARRMEEAR